MLDLTLLSVPRQADRGSEEPPEKRVGHMGKKDAERGTPE